MSLEEDGTRRYLRVQQQHDERKREKELGCAVDVTIDSSSLLEGLEGAQMAAETIQCAWRQRTARLEARRRLAKAYVKRPTPSGSVYYEDIRTGVTTWERPHLVSRLFPDSVW